MLSADRDFSWFPAIKVINPRASWPAISSAVRRRCQTLVIGPELSEFNW